MHIGILASSESWYFRDLTRAATPLGMQATRLDFERMVTHVNDGEVKLLCGQIPLDQFRAVVVRTMPPGSLEQVVYRMNLLAFATERGVRVVNSPRSIECAVDKLLTTVRLQQAGLPVPATAGCETLDEALDAFAKLGGDVVVKPLFGSEGRGIVRVSDPDLAWRTLATLSRLSAVLYLQQFIKHPGYDTRVLVLDGRVLGGMRRYSDHDFRTNVARDARGTRYTPTDYECELALRAAKATGATFAGIDLLEDETGQTLVIEVNAVPGWKAFAQANEMDVAQVFLSWLKRSLED